MKERNTVSQAREESFSSQNVNLFITAISKRGSSGSGFTVGISEGSSFFVSKTFHDEFSLENGTEVDEDFLEKLEFESDCVMALQKAGDLIGRAEQSSGGLYVKLKKKGFSDGACKNAVERVCQLNLINDERFAEMWISSRLRSHPEGKSALYKGLLSRGVKSKSAKSALEQNLSEEDLHRAVQKAGRKLLVKYRDSNLKVKQALYRRGFTSGEIQYFLENTDV